MGGIAGHYNFIHLSNNTDILPDGHAQNGTMGDQGRTAEPCQTYDRIVKLENSHHGYLALIVPMHTEKFKFTSYEVNNQRCLTTFESTTEEVRMPNLPREMNITAEVSRYKTFLLENMETFEAKRIRETIDAIDENLEIVKSV